MSEDEMAGQHHRCNEHELGSTLRDSEGQGGLACHGCPWGQKEPDTPGLLNKDDVFQVSGVMYSLGCVLDYYCIKCISF